MSGTFRCLNCKEEIAIPEVVTQPVWITCPHRCGARNWYEPGKGEATKMEMKKGNSSATYGPPWKKYRRGIREDVVRLGYGPAKKLWESRGISASSFGQLALGLKGKAKEHPPSPPEPFPLPPPLSQPQGHTAEYWQGRCEGMERALELLRVKGG